MRVIARSGSALYDGEPLNRIPKALFALLLWPALALAQAQSGFGLDLSTPPSKETPAKAQSSAPPLAERDITLEDRVKSVQRKVYLKKHRVELAPFVTYSLNDPYYSKAGLALRAAYFLSDTLAVAARGSLIRVLGSDDVRIAKRNFQSSIFWSDPQWSAMGDVEWSPVYGKLEIWNSILHFDGYLLGGAGVVSTATSATNGLNPAGELGVGMRVVARDFLAVNVAIINTAYVDQPAGTTKAAAQNILSLNAGISLFFPFRSTGRESE